jgi:hypothetical protein
MNVPAQTTNGACSSQVIRAAACALLYATVQNTHGSADRFYFLADAASLPALTASAIMQPCGGILSPRIGAGATWRAFGLDAATGGDFTRGCVLMSFGTKADGQPDFTQLSAADANLTAWSALLA